MINTEIVTDFYKFYEDNQEFIKERYKEATDLMNDSVELNLDVD